MTEPQQPLFESVQILRLQPKDVLVVEASGRLTFPQAEHLAERVSEQFPKHKVIVLTPDVRLRVVRKELKW